jgi:glycosyltransferase involved in cell wall biosynthesis
MKVIHLITRLNKGGTSKWLRILSINSEKFGWESIIVCGYVEEHEINSDEINEDLIIRLPTLHKKFSLIDDTKALFQIIKIICVLKPDIVNTHTAKAGLLGRIAIVPFYLLNRPKLIHTYHGHLIYGYFNNFTSKLIVVAERFLSKFTHGFIVAGDSIAVDLKTSRVIKNNSFTVIYPPDEKSKIPKTNLRNFFGFEPSDIVIGWMGRFEKIKCPERVLELALLFPELKFVMAGEGSLRSEIQVNAPKNVFFTGWAESSFLWSETDIALLTSLNEAVPFVLIECGGHKVPAIAENVGSVKDIIQNNLNGFLTSSLQERVDAIEILVSSKDKRIKMGENAFKLIESNFSVEKFSDSHYKFYNQILSKKKSDVRK